jgi:hypothetical protein
MRFSSASFPAVSRPVLVGFGRFRRRARRTSTCLSYTPLIFTELKLGSGQRVLITVLAVLGRCLRTR